MRALHAACALLLAWLMLAASPANAATADLALTMVRSGSYKAGTSFTYALTVTNNGSGKENGTITIARTLPAGLRVTGTSGIDWTCNDATGICSNSANLAVNGKSSVLTLTLEATSVGQKTASMTVSGSNDSNANNNTVTDTGTYFAPPDLAITLARTGSFKVGTNVTYAVTVTNKGLGAESGTVTVGGTIAAGLTLVSFSGAGWSCAPGGELGTCSYSGGLAPGATAPALTVTVYVATEGYKTATAKVTGSAEDINANNTVSDTGTAFSSADLSIAMVRSGTFQVGKSLTYSVTVTNKGTGSEFGTITVGGSASVGLSVSALGGDGWSCTRSGTLGNCTYDADLAPGASASVLTITALVTTAGQRSLSATVTGTSDPVSANNTVTDTGTALPEDPPVQPAVTKYALTDRACAIGTTVGAANACDYYKAPTTAGRAGTIYLTATDADGKAKAPPTTPVSMQFALRCINPAATAGIKASMGGAELPACAPKADTLQDATRWSAALDVAFAANQASAALSFRYADVGAVELHLRQGGTAGTAAGFISKPWMVDFRGISRGGVAAPSTVAANGPAFAMAGEPVLVEIGARVEDAAGKVTWAPNFGNETTRPALALGRAALFTDASKTDYLQPGPPLAFDEASWKSAAGKWWVNASWGEVGATTFTIGLPDYLGAGLVTGSGQNVGRFYPAWFTTEISPPVVVCGSGIACPTRTPDPVGVAYSGQQFIARVVARGVQGQELANFTGAWFRAIKLSAVDAKGAAAAAGVLAPLQLNASGSHRLTYTLPNPYTALSPRAGNWSAPATFYLRAQAQDGPDPKGISSERIAPAVSDEDALVVVSGRLRVPNALGTDMLRTPLALRAEYWSGTAWRGHAEYTEPLVRDAALARFSLCTSTLAGTGTACNPALVSVAALPPPLPNTIKLEKGAAVLWLAAPGKLAGKRRDGAVSVQFDAWTWLPSTIGRVNFGSHRSPLIYVREVY